MSEKRGVRILVSISKREREGGWMCTMYERRGVVQ